MDVAVAEPRDDAEHLRRDHVSPDVREHDGAQVRGAQPFVGERRARAEASGEHATERQQQRAEDDRDAVDDDVPAMCERPQVDGDAECVVPRRRRLCIERPCGEDRDHEDDE